jgi:hypothetical protein
MPKALPTPPDDAESAAIRNQQDLVDAVLAADGSHIQLAPPTYRVRGVRPLALDPACAPEGDAALRFFGAQPDISAVESAETADEWAARVAQGTYLRALAEYAAMAHDTGARWESAWKCTLWVYYKWLVRHLRLTTPAESALLERVAEGLWTAQQGAGRAVTRAMETITAEPPRAA